MSTVPHSRSNTDTSGPGMQSIPTTAEVHDKYPDLLTIVISQKQRGFEPSFERVVIRNADDEDKNPTLSDMLGIQPR